MNSDAYHSRNYYITDHLGSTRKVVTDANTIKETINYYPYGSEMRLTDPAVMPNSTFKESFRFSGKELDWLDGLNMYDFGARMFDVAGVPVWTSMDPLAEDNSHVTPYSYCNGDPVNRFDPDGMEVLDKLSTKSEGEEIAKQNYLDNIEDNDNAIIFMAHGTTTGSGMFATEDGLNQKKIGDPYTMEECLDKNSSVWNTRLITADTPEIVLFSCNAGKAEGIAQRISFDEAYKDIKIYAPSDNISIYPNGTCSVDNGGRWCEYVNGKLINTYSGNLVPGTKEFTKASYWDKNALNTD